ncbi:site-specific DNA-methyltransferase [Canibacter sp. lx-45]|uniref:site-specific DNA-methyltransferase n=1 Tax=Canibacter zhuwentaonis TaxID=2837491 RepID=UPI001BDD998E|nr:site-specific DNA-methyltransferase [Canibacter zhuwentaonis]
MLEALTRVPELADKYVGKIKLIYIDPPFNTAQTFASYEDNLEHSIWLTMMRDRLTHMKKLLADNGSIWVHLDYAENHRMRLLLDEVFGAVNFVAEIVWEKVYAPQSHAQRVSVDQDVILCYAASKATRLHRMPRTAAENARYSNPDNDVLGIWKSGDLSAPGNLSGKRQGPSLFGIQHPISGAVHFPVRGGQWRFKTSRLLESLSEFGHYVFAEPDLKARAQQSGLKTDQLRQDIPDLLIDPELAAESRAMAERRIQRGAWPEFFVKERGFGRKVYLPPVGQPARSWWSNDQVGHNHEAKSEIKALFPDQAVFSTPKPERLLERIIHIGSNPGDTVLDVFAGSGTTAAVAQKMGRRWVTCELLAATFTRVTRPRLEKVINDEDPGGITRTKGERVAADNAQFPEGVSPDDAAKFTSVLNKLIADDAAAKRDPLVKALKNAAKTKRTKEVLNWRGGGGFQVAHLSPACFDYDPELGRVLLTPEATGQVLIESVAANLGFTLLHADDDHVFDARRGSALLKVIEGVATTEITDWLAAHVRPGETITLAATGVADGVREYLRRTVKGSRVVALPDDLFNYSEDGEL